MSRLSDPRGPLACALHAAARGWPVFPLRAGGKFPAIRGAHPYGHPCRGECGRFGHGFHDATTDPEVIRAWWRAWPRANYGISTGPAGLVVIDLDTGKGAPPTPVLPDQQPDERTPDGLRDGAGVLGWAASRDSGRLDGPGDTLTVATPSGGRHLYYAAPADPSGPAGRVVVRSSTGAARTPAGWRITGLGWCVDVRAVGGYVGGPGSVVDGIAYRALSRAAVAPLPGWLLARLAAAGSVPSMASPPPPCTPEQRAGAGSRAGLTRVRAGGYAAAAVAGELANIAAAVAGDTGGAGRNATVNRAAYKLGRLVHAAGLDLDQLTEQLVAAALATGLGEREARTAVASGLGQGQANPRTLTHAGAPVGARVSQSREARS